MNARMARCAAGGLLLAVGTVLGGMIGRSQPAGQPAMDKKTIAAMMAQKGAPGAEHKVLESMAGDSTLEIKMMMGPGMPPLVAKAVGSSKMVLGNRFLEIRSSPADGEELKIETVGYIGFDKRNKKYFWWAIDSTDTYSIFSEGDYDAATRTFTFLGTNDEPGMGKMPFKFILKLTDDTHRTTELWFQMKGAPGADADGWFQIMEMKSTKK